MTSERKRIILIITVTVLAVFLVLFTCLVLTLWKEYEFQGYYDPGTNTFVQDEKYTTTVTVTYERKFFKLRPVAIGWTFYSDKSGKENAEAIRDEMVSRNRLEKTGEFDEGDQASEYYGSDNKKLEFTESRKGDCFLLLNYSEELNDNKVESEILGIKVRPETIDDFTLEIMKAGFEPKLETMWTGLDLLRNL